MSLHSSHSVVFEDGYSESCFDLDSGRLDRRNFSPTQKPTKLEKYDFHHQKLGRVDDIKPVMTKASTPDRRDVSRETGFRRGFRRETSSQNGGAWFTLSSSTISELAAQNSLPSLETKEEWSTSPETTDWNASGNLSVNALTSEIEQTAREMETALLRKLGNLETDTDRTKQADATPVHKNSGKALGRERIDTIKPIPGASLFATKGARTGRESSISLRTETELEALEMAETLERKQKTKPTTRAPLFQRKDARDGHGSATSVLTRTEFEALEMAEALEHKLRSMGHNAPISSDAPAESKARASHEDEIGTNMTAKSKESTEILTSPSDSDDSCDSGSHSEPNDWAARETQHEEPVFVGDPNDEESMRQSENSFGVYSHGESESDGTYESEPTNSSLPQQLRDEESNQSSDDLFARENRNEHYEKNHTAGVIESVIERALKKLKDAVAAGIPETESLFLRCLKEAKLEQGDSSYVEQRHDDRIIPDEIEIWNEDNSSNEKNNNFKRTKPSVRFSNEAYGHYGDYQMSNHSEAFSEIEMMESQSSSRAASFASDRTKNSIENKRGRKTSRNREERGPSRKSAVKRARNQIAPHPPTSPHDWGSCVTDESGSNDEIGNSFCSTDILDLALRRSQRLAEASKREGRSTKRMMITISIILSVAFLIILFVVLDPLRRWI